MGTYRNTLRSLACGLLLTLTGMDGTQAQDSCTWTTRDIAGADGLAPTLAVEASSDGWYVHSVDASGRLGLRRCGLTGYCESQTQVSQDNELVDAVVSTRTGPQTPLAVYHEAVSDRLYLSQCTSWGGCSYSERRQLDPQAAPQRAASMTTDGDGFPRIAYARGAAGNDSNLRLYRCVDARCTSGASIALADGVGATTALATVRDAGIWRSVVLYNDAADATIHRATCIGGCAEGSASTDAFVSGRDAALLPAANAADGFDVVYTRATGGLGFVHCADGSCSQRTDRTLVIRAAVGHQPRMQRRSDGRLLITHQDLATGTLRLYRCADTTCSSGDDIAFDTDAVDGQSHVPVLTVPDGRPAAFVLDHASANLRATRCDDGDCTTVTRVHVSNGRDVSFADVALRTDGRPLVAWTDDVAGGDSTWLHRCDDTACTSGSDIRVAITSNYNASPRLLLRPDGRPGLLVPATGGLAFQDCSDADCTTFNPRSVTASGSGTGDVFAATLRADGVPIFAYVDSSNPGGSGTRNDVYAYACIDTGCSGGTAHLLGDFSSAAWIGNLSIVADASGRMVGAWTVSEGGVSSAHLAVCSDANCTQRFDRVLGTGTILDLDLALRGDGMPLLFERTQAGSQLRDCQDTSCTSDVPRPIPVAPWGNARFALRPDGTPLFVDGDGTGQATLHDCVTPACTAPVVTPVASGGVLAVGGVVLPAVGSPRVALVETTRRDAKLAVCVDGPRPPEIFADGFELGAP